MKQYMKYFLLGVLVVGANLAWANADNEEMTIVIKDHRFLPEETVVPAGKRIKLIIDNQDPTPEEFESYALNREKIVGAKKQTVIFVGPLKKGRYAFMGEFHQATAKGVLIAQ